jgi:hypothetical protein
MVYFEYSIFEYTHKPHSKMTTHHRFFDERKNLQRENRPTAHSITLYFYSHHLLTSSTGNFFKYHMSQCCMRSPVEVDVESEMENIRQLYCVLLSCFHTVNYAHLQCVVNLVDMRSNKELELLSLTVWCSAKTKSGWTAIFGLYRSVECFQPEE